MQVFDEPTMTLLIRNIAQYIAVIAGYSVLLWMACEGTGLAFPQPYRTRVKLALNYLMGPLGGCALYGVDWLPLPETPGPWPWVLAGLTGLCATVAAERIINDTLIGRFLTIWKKNGGTE